jgi:hypothetical protein
MNSRQVIDPNESMICTRQIVDLNNSAVAFLQEERPKQAIDLLRVAVTNLAKDQYSVCRPDASFQQSCESVGPRRRLVSECSIDADSEDAANESAVSSLPSNEDEVDDDCSQYMDFDQEHVKPSVLGVPIFEVLVSRPQTKDNSLLSLYNHALLVSLNEQDQELISAVVLYNMALVNHCRAIERGISSLLQIALELYEMALGIVSQDQECTQSQHEHNLLYMAILNNMAKIHADLFAVDEMRHCINSLRKILSVLHHEGCCCIDESDFTFFFMNAMLNLEDPFLAPAA